MSSKASFSQSSILSVRFLWENQNQDLRIQNWIFRFLFCFVWTNPKTDHESIKSTLWVDSSNQNQIRIFENHNLSVFLDGGGGGDRKGFEKIDKRYSDQKWYIRDALNA